MIQETITINTPKDLQVALLSMPEVVALEFEEYLEEPAFVLLVEITFYHKLKCLFSKKHKKLMLLKFNEILHQLPAGIKVSLHFVV